MQYSNEPSGYDEQRMHRLDPLRKEIDGLGLPPLRLRKLKGILNALEMQIEDGGESPAAERLLLDALRQALLHQVGAELGAPALRAADALAQEEGWVVGRDGEDREPVHGAAGPMARHEPERPRAETEAIRRLDALVAQGYGVQVLNLGDPCPLWLEAWDIARSLATPEMRSAEAFAERFPGTALSSSWLVELLLGLKEEPDDRARLDTVVRLASEFLGQFSEGDRQDLVAIARVRSRALSILGRLDEADRSLADTVRRWPQDGEAHIDWALWHTEHDATREAGLVRAIEILRAAQAVPGLSDRANLLAVLRDLGHEQAAARREAREAARKLASARAAAPTEATPPAGQGGVEAEEFPGHPRPAPKGPARNKPCWCGSGKKYKHCHMAADRAAARPPTGPSYDDWGELDGEEGDLPPSA